MNIRKLILLTFISLFFGCKRQEKQKNEITKIYIATGLCYGYCPIQSVEIDSSLTVKYYGKNYAKKKGFYIGKITPEVWDSINSRFERIKFKELDSVNNHSIDDPPVYLKINYNNQVKKVRAQSSSLPDEVKKNISLGDNGS